MARPRCQRFRKMIEEKSGEEPEHDHRKPILYAMTVLRGCGASCDGDAEIRRCAAVSGENKGADGSSGGKRTGREDTDGGECSGSISGGRGKHRGKYRHRKVQERNWKRKMRAECGGMRSEIYPNGSGRQRRAKHIRRGSRLVQRRTIPVRRRQIQHREQSHRPPRGTASRQ